MGCGILWCKCIKTFRRQSYAAVELCVLQSVPSTLHHTLFSSLVVLRLSVPEEQFESGLSEHLGDHVLGDGSQGVQQLALQPGLHDQQIHVYLGEGEKSIKPSAGRKWLKGRRRR